MNQEKYIGMDVHAATISVAVMNAQGKVLMECVLESKAVTILEFIQGLRGTLALTFEEGTMAAWLHDLLKPHVSRLVVCDPRKNALLRDGSQNDRADARNLAELLRTNQVHAVYHGQHGTRASGSPTRAVAGESQACGGETTWPDSCDRSDSLRPAGGLAADAPSLPYQAPALGLQRFCRPDV